GGRGVSRSAGDRSTTTSTSRAVRLGSTSTTPTPQRVSPGSMPSTRTATGLVLGLALGLNVGREVEVSVDVLHVVAVLERVDEPEDLAGRVGVDLDLEVRHERGISGV